MITCCIDGRSLPVESSLPICLNASGCLSLPDLQAFRSVVLLHFATRWRCVSLFLAAGDTVRGSIRRTPLCTGDHITLCCRLPRPTVSRRQQHNDSGNTAWPTQTRMGRIALVHPNLPSRRQLADSPSLFFAQIFCAFTPTLNVRTFCAPEEW